MREAGGKPARGAVPRRGAARVAQAWIELKTDDPAAMSALAIARQQLPAGRRLVHLRRARLVELTGSLPSGAALERRLHESTRFYNPHKESCHVRFQPSDRAPMEPGDQAILVTERGATRREAAERWWQHATGERIAVREAVVWVLRFESGADARSEAEALTVVRDRRHGLFCNPNAQQAARSGAEVPLPWIDEGAAGGNSE
jgi:hypothetical protein